MSPLLLAALFGATGVWGNPGDWVVADEKTGQVEHLELFDNERARDIAVSRDGQRFVVVLERDGLLYAWTRSSRLRHIGPKAGFIADPALSPDGEKVYFSHNTNEGAPGAHDPRTWAQIWSIGWDGTHQTQHTATAGCHIAPSVGDSGTIAFIHSTCQGDFGDGEVDSRLTETPLNPVVGRIKDSFRFMNQRFAVVDIGQTRRITQTTPTKTQPRFTKTTLIADAYRARPLVGDDGHKLCLQSVDSVACISTRTGAKSTLARIKWRNP